MRILSIDVGSHSVKVLELEVAFGRQELVDYFLEKIIEPELSSALTQGPSEKTATDAQSDEVTAEHKAPAKANERKAVFTHGQIGAIYRILHERPFNYKKLVVGIPMGLVTTRLLSFPTKDKKTIQKSIAFELEDEIPVDLEDTTRDFSMVMTPNGPTMVYTVIAINKDLSSMIAALRSINLDPDVVTTEGWALSQLLSRTAPPHLAGAPMCVINLGAKQTSFHMVIADKPVISHTVNVGGNSITHAIAARYGLKFDQAEKAKIEGSFLLTKKHLEDPQYSRDITDEQKAFAQTISDAMIPIVREIRQVLMSFRSEYHMNPKVIYITGGTSQIPNISPYLEESLGMPVFPLELTQRVITDAVELSVTTQSFFSNALGFALTAIKPEKGAGINLRKDAFRKEVGVTALSLKSFKKPLQYITASLVFIYANLIVQYFVLNAKFEKQDLAFERAIKSVLGSTSKSSLATYISSPSTLRKAVEKEIAKYKPMDIMPSSQNASGLDVLSHMSSAISKQTTLDVSLFSVNEGLLTISGLVGSMPETDILAKELENSKFLKDIDKSAPEIDRKTQRVKFTFKAKILEDQLGKD